MPDYAGYEPFEELHRGPLATVWKAHRRDDAGGKVFAVKVRRSAELLAEETPARDVVSRLLESAEEMQKLAAAGAKHWVPVDALGQVGSGEDTEAFWVTRFYARSLERVIEGHAHLASFDIHWIVSALVRGLRELESTLERPHGNLEPTNIFIDGDGRIGAAGILLSDLWPRSALVLPEDRTADFHAVGRIIVHLARRQGSSLRTSIGWPLEPGEEWRRLGRTGEGWRELCNLLLKPEPAAGEHDWAAIAERLEPLGIRPPPPWKSLAVAGSVFAVLLGGGCSYLRWAPLEGIPSALQPLAISLGNVTGDREEAPREWAILCNFYYNWLLSFESQLKLQANLDRWRQDAQLNENVIQVLLEARDEYDALDPRILARIDPLGSLLALRDFPPPESMRGLAAVRVPKVTRLVQKAQAGFADWDTRAKLRETAARFDSLGWTQPGAQLRDVHRAGASGDIIAENIDDIIRLGPITARVFRLWDAIEPRVRLLAAADDPVMSGLPEYVAGRTAIADLDTLDRELGTLEVESLRWTDWVQGGPGGEAKFDLERFKEESALRDFSGPVTAEILQMWDREVAEFAYVAEAADPRPARRSEWSDGLRDVDELFRLINDEVTAGAPTDGEPARLQAHRATVQQEIDELLARERIVRHDLSIVIDVGDSIRKLTSEARELWERIAPDPANWLRYVEAVSFGPDGAPLEREWRRRRDEVLRGATADSLGADSAAFRKLRGTYYLLERFFRDITGERGLGALPRLGSQDFAPELRPPLESWAASGAQSVLEDWLRQLQTPGGMPGETAEVFLARPSVRAVTDRFAAALADARLMAHDFTALRDRLQQVGTPDEASDGGLAGAAAAAASWRRHPVMNALGEAGVFRSLLDAAGLLGQINAGLPRDALVEAAGSPWLGIAWAAWRRLGTIATWPAPADLETESRLQSDLRERVERLVTDAKRSSPLLDELTVEAGRRWRVALRAALDDAALEIVLRLREAFRVREEDLSGEERLNVELYRIKQRDWGLLAPDLISKARDDSVHHLRELAGPAPKPEFADWLEKLMEIDLVVPKGEEADVRKLGPGRRGWVGDVARDPRQVEFRWTGPNGEHRLKFWQIEGDGIHSFFLSTTELPIGLLVDLADANEVREKLKPWLTTVVDDGIGGDRRIGPQSWWLDASGRLQLHATWTLERQTSWPWTSGETQQFYPADVKPGAKRISEAPINYIPATAGRFLAEDLLGCRFPSPQEWAVLIEAGLLVAEQKSGQANLRDLQWLLERDYLLGLGLIVRDSPLDQNIFWPPSKGIPKIGAEAQAAVGDRRDGALWFESVNSREVDGGPIQHLLGNVAEFLFDETTGRYFVAGNSALSPPELDPAVPYPVTKAFADSGFSDVGLRVAFDATPAVVSRNRLIALIRNQPYVRY